MFRSESVFKIVIAICGTVLVSSCTTSSYQKYQNQDEVVLSDQVILAEKIWLETLGVKLEHGSPLKKTPFSDVSSKRSYLTPSSWYKDWVKKIKNKELSPQSLIVKEAFIRDLDYLEIAFQEVYGGWTFLQKKGFNWKSFFEKWKSSLPQSKMISLGEAFAPWLHFRHTFIDNHTGPVFNGSLSILSGNNGSRTYKLSEQTLEPCDSANMDSDAVIDLRTSDISHRPRQALNTHLKPISYITFPSSWGVGRSLRCKDKTISITSLEENIDLEKQIEGFTGEKANIPAVKVVGKFVYVRVPTLVKSNYEYYEKLLKKYKKTDFTGKRVIIDLRSNGGGDGESVFEFLSLFVPLKQALKNAKMKRLLVSSCLATAMKFGYTQITAPLVTASAPESLTRMIQSSYDSLFPDGNCSRAESWEVGRFSFKDRPKTNFKKSKVNLLILVNRGTGSDAEWLTYILRSLDNSALIGENTYGVGQFVQPSYFSLPHTKIPFRIARGMSDLYGDERSFDGFGLDVDILLGSEEQDPSMLIKILDRI